METVTVSRTIEAPEPTVQEWITDTKPFIEAAGFDEVAVKGDVIEITNNVGLLTIELILRVLEIDDALAYEQVDGIFDEMETRYTLEERSEGIEITAVTEYALDVALVGSILDSTIIARQRRKELSAQFDYLERRAEKYEPSAK
ncbi:MAG: SRPBCC family protein [Haloarculaceae archaeon]